MMELAGRFHRPGQQQAVKGMAIRQFDCLFGDALQVSMGILIRLALEAHLRADVVGARRLADFDFARGEALAMLFDLAQVDGEEPRLGAVREDHAVALEFVQRISLPPGHGRLATPLTSRSMKVDPSVASSIFIHPVLSYRERHRTGQSQACC